MKLIDVIGNQPGRVLRIAAREWDRSQPYGSSGVRRCPVRSTSHAPVLVRQGELYRDALDPDLQRPAVPAVTGRDPQLLQQGFLASALAYHCGGLPDWVTLAHPTRGPDCVRYPQGYTRLMTQEMHMTTDATIEQLEQARTEGAVVVDVRELDEYVEGHVAGARSLPLRQLPARAQDVPKDRTVYLVCQGGGRSSQAAELLSAAGHDVRSVVGGTTAWIEAGGETASGRD